jgi:hypothetical protein
MPGPERRRAPRARLGPLDVSLGGSNGSLIDLSVLGALVRLPLAQVADASATLRIDAQDGAVTLRARVVRSIPGEAGYAVAIEFDELSMDDLLRLSELIDAPGEPEETTGFGKPLFT